MTGYEKSPELGRLADFQVIFIKYPLCYSIGWAIKPTLRVCICS